MGLFGNKENSSQGENEGREFDLRSSLRGMTEKQLLKLLILMEWENYNNEVSESYVDLLNIAKED